MHTHRETDAHTERDTHTDTETHTHRDRRTHTQMLWTNTISDMCQPVYHDVT